MSRKNGNLVIFKISGDTAARAQKCKIPTSGGNLTNSETSSVVLAYFLFAYRISYYTLAASLDDMSQL